MNSSIQNPAHSYTIGGYYDVSLISSDNFGCADTLLINNLVYIPGPILDFDIDQLFGCDSLTISIVIILLIHQIIYSILETVRHQVFKNPIHTYSNPGAYQISLVGEDSAGCQVAFTSSDLISVDVTPVLELSSF